MNTPKSTFAKIVRPQLAFFRSSRTLPSSRLQSKHLEAVGNQWKVRERLWKDRGKAVKGQRKVGGKAVERRRWKQHRPSVGR